jgi:hypothetical protein
MRLGSIIAATRRSLVGPKDHRLTNRQTLRLYLRGPRAAAAALRQGA